MYRFMNDMMVSRMFNIVTTSLIIITYRNFLYIGLVNFILDINCFDSCSDTCPTINFADIHWIFDMIMLLCNRYTIWRYRV